VSGNWLTDDQQRIWRNYLALGARLQTAMNRQLQRDCGLSLADYEVLVALSELGETRIYELGDHLSWEQSRLSHQLRRMRLRGLIVRHDSAEDRRGATVEITKVGRGVISAAAPGHVDLVRSVVFDGLGAADLRALDALTTSALTRLAEHETATLG